MTSRSWGLFTWRKTLPSDLSLNKCKDLSFSFSFFISSSLQMWLWRDSPPLTFVPKPSVRIKTIARYFYYLFTILQSLSCLSSSQSLRQMILDCLQWKTTALSKTKGLKVIDSRLSQWRLTMLWEIASRFHARPEDGKFKLERTAHRVRYLYFLRRNLFFWPKKTQIWMWSGREWECKGSWLARLVQKAPITWLPFDHRSRTTVIISHW